MKEFEYQAPASLDQAVDSTDTRNLLFAKIEDRVTPNNRLTGSFNYYTRLQPHGGVGGNTVATNAINFDWTIYKYNATFNSVIGCCAGTGQSIGSSRAASSSVYRTPASRQICSREGSGRRAPGASSSNG